MILNTYRALETLRFVRRALYDAERLLHIFLAHFYFLSLQLPHVDMSPLAIEQFQHDLIVTTTSWFCLQKYSLLMSSY
jgi:hypothetical protein